jgi:hypothetical protein
MKGIVSSSGDKDLIMYLSFTGSISKRGNKTKEETRVMMMMVEILRDKILK